MAQDSEPSAAEDERNRRQSPPPPAHHPPALADELFDVSTTVDPSYVISLIRKLLPPKAVSSCNSKAVDPCDDTCQGLKIGHDEESALPSSDNGSSNFVADAAEPMDTLDGNDDGKDEGYSKSGEHSDAMPGDQAWEEFGCILWDLAASRQHAEFMVQNFVLEVLLANLMVSDSVRIKEICLGIIGNLACHDAPMKHIISIKGLMEIILDQLFVDDTPCLCEVFRLLALGLQGSEGATWADALQSEHILSRLLWVAENTLNPLLIEKSVALLLAFMESQLDVARAVLADMMKLGLADLLKNLFLFEMSKLMTQRMPERYAALDSICRAIEALSTIDEYSKEICSNKDLIKMVFDLVRLPDKIEVASSCITVVILIANILSDMDDLASQLSHDLTFLQGLLEILPFASNDVEAWGATWNILSRLLVRVQESMMSPSMLHQYVLVLSVNSELIEEDLLNNQFDHSCEDQESLSTAVRNLQARNIALRRMVSILNSWTTLKVQAAAKRVTVDEHVDEGSISRLLDCCLNNIF